MGHVSVDMVLPSRSSRRFDRERPAWNARGALRRRRCGFDGLAAGCARRSQALAGVCWWAASLPIVAAVSARERRLLK